MCKDIPMNHSKSTPSMEGTSLSPVKEPLTSNGRMHMEGRVDGYSIHSTIQLPQSPSSSPGKIRFRVPKNSPSSLPSLKSDDESNRPPNIPNIEGGNTTINITNFGMISLSPWRKDRHAKIKSGRCILSSVLVALLTLWVGTIMAMMKTPQPAPAVDSLHLTRPSQKKSDGMRGMRQAVSLEVGTNGEEDTKDISAMMISPSTQSLEDSPPNLYGFKFSTPTAPSCSIPLDKSSVSFTLVTQLSEDRVWMIEHHCKRWGNHPMSIVILSDQDAATVKSQLVSQGCFETNLEVQTVSKTKYDPSGTEYPVNILRNLALSVVKTTHIVYADVDFWPTTQLHPILSTEKVKERFASDPKIATVIPAFQMTRRCKYYDCRDLNVQSMPKQKKMLMMLVKKGTATSFDPTNKGGHGSTKYLTWKDQEPGSFRELPCIRSNRYEPYLVVRYCSDLPPFQEVFTGYGKNKMTWAMQLRRTGYLFSQLGGAFFIHYPHLDSPSRQEWNKKPKSLAQNKVASVGELLEQSVEKIDLSVYKRARVDALFLEFREWLGKEVEDESRVRMCADALNDDERLWVHPPDAESR